METGVQVIQASFLLDSDGLVNLLLGFYDPGEERPQKCDDWDSFQSAVWLRSLCHTSMEQFIYTEL